MKRLKKILSFILIMGVALSFSNTKSVAAGVQYTENVIPTMTSDTSPSGTASASCVNLNKDGKPASAAYLAFDHNTAQYKCWAATYGTSSGWLEYDFVDEKCITKYTVQPRDWDTYACQSPKDWTFEAWDETTSAWVVLDTQTNITGWKVGTKKEFTFSNTNIYHKYRINASSIEDGSSLLNQDYRTIVIGELEMMETVPQGANATIYITMVTGEIKEYHVDSDIKQDYLTWYDDRSNGSGKAYYIFTKDNTGGFLSRKEYLSFDKISSFEIMEYND